MRVHVDYLNNEILIVGHLVLLVDKNSIYLKKNETIYLIFDVINYKHNFSYKISRHCCIAAEFGSRFEKCSGAFLRAL